MDLWAFPVCRYYTIRAQHGEPTVVERCTDEDDPGLAGAQRYGDDREYLQPYRQREQESQCGRDW